VSTVSTPTRTEREPPSVVISARLRVEWPLVPTRRRTPAVFEALRPYQWSKNVLVFVPFLLGHQAADLRRWCLLGIAFVALSACASAGYLLNDLLDLDADRRHPTKRRRPLAAGRLGVGTAVGLLVGLLVGSFALSAVCLPRAFTGMLALYAIGTAGYSIHFKRTLFLDILALAGLYTLRMLAGGVVGEVEVSQWLRAFAMFFFISMALLKRYLELIATEDPRPLGENRRGYLPDDAPLVQTIGLVSGYLSVLVMCLYLSSSRVQMLYPRFELLWLIVPALVYWISRIWILARRRAVAEDPVAAALVDPPSYAVAAVCVVVAAVAAW
jgi:4-hydroxybenzoate polyprenyltransferase